MEIRCFSRHGLIAVWQGHDEIMDAGFLRCRYDFFHAGLRLSDPYVFFHAQIKEKDLLLNDGKKTV